jgi:ATP-dependent helicase/DNAse subunit B
MNYLLYNNKIKNINIFYNLEIIENNIFEELNNNNKSNIRIIFPTKKLCVHTEKLFINKLWDYAQKPYKDRVFYNFYDFVKIIGNIINYEIKKMPLKEEEFFALMEIAYKNSKFKYYSLHNKIPTKKITNLLSNIIWGFIKDGITPEDLKNDLNNNENKIQNKDKLEDIINVYEELLKLTKDYYTENDIITDIINKINSDKYNFNNEDNIYYLKYFKQFKKKEIEFLKLLFDNDLKLIINFDFLEVNHPQKNIYNGINEIITNNVKLEELNNSSELNQNISKYLFNYDYKFAGKINLDSEFEIAECDDKNSEIEYITKLVKKLIIEDNIEPKDIFIFARTPQNYNKLLKYSFDNNQIPLNISDRYNLNESPIINLIINYLELINSGFNNKYLFKLINSPWFKFESNFDKLEFISLTNKYRISFNDLKNREKIIDKFITESNNQKIQNELSKYKNKLKYIFEYFNLKNKNKYSKNELIDLITEFIKLINFDFVYSIDEDSIIKEEDIKFHYFYKTREKERIFSAITKFYDVVDDILTFKLKHNNKTEIKIKEFLESLYFNMDRDRFQIRELYDTSVTFTSIEQGRGVKRKVSILCGAVEGQFPIHYKTDEVIGRELKYSEILHNKNEEELFYEFLYPTTDLSEKIYITYPSLDGSKSLVQSHFVKEIKRLINPVNLIIKNSIEINNFNKKYILSQKNNIFDANIISEYYESNNKNGKFSNNLSNDAKTQIEKISQQTLSPTKIDTLKNHPYVFLVQNIMGFRTKDDYDELPKKNETGTIHHEILSRIYSSFSSITQKNKGFAFYLKPKNTELGDIYPININNISNYDSLVNDEINKVFNNYPINEFFSFQKNITQNIIFEILENEKLLLEHFKLFQSLFEFNFKKDALVYEYNFSDIDFKFAGTIDRVDLGYIDGKLYFGIVDYKSKKNDNAIHKENLKGDKSFQMYIYLKAMLNILKNNYKIVFEGDEIDIIEDNVIMAYAYYYPLDNLSGKQGVNIYGQQKLFYSLDNRNKNIIEEITLEMQQNDLNNTLQQLIYKDFSNNEFQNKYAQEVNLMIR